MNKVSDAELKRYNDHILKPRQDAEKKRIEMQHSGVVILADILPMVFDGKVVK